MRYALSITFRTTFCKPCIVTACSLQSLWLVWLVQVVSRDIRRLLTQRALFFNLVLDDVSITTLTFGREYTQAVEAKQVAQQEAERAKFLVRFHKLHNKQLHTVVSAKGSLLQSASWFGRQGF